METFDEIFEKVVYQSRNLQNSFRRREIDGDLLRLQVHRDLCGHQPQRRRAVSRDPNPDTPQAGESRENARPLPEAQLEQEEPEQEQVPRFRFGHAHRKRPEFPQKVQGESHFRQFESQEFVGESLG